MRKRLEARDGTLRGGLPYRAVGAGPTLVVFPGLAGENADPGGRTRPTHLRPFLPLARDLTVYLINRRPGLDEGCTIADLAAQYADAIAHEFLGPVHVAGVSTGGSIGQRFATDHPRLVRRLVLAATACRLSPYGRESNEPSPG